MELDKALHKRANLLNLSKEINKKFSGDEYFKDFKCKIERGNLVIIDKTDNSEFLKGVPKTGLVDETAYTTKVAWSDADTKQELGISPAVYGKPGNGTYEKAINVLKEIIKDLDERRKMEMEQIER